MKNKFDDLRIEDLEKHPENLPLFEKGVEEILTGRCYACKDHAGVKTHIRLSDGTRFFRSTLLHFFLNQHTKAGFNCEQAITFCEAYRKLMGWRMFTDYPLMQWIKQVVVEPFFINEGSKYSEKYVKRTDVDWQLVNQEEILRFVCYVGIGYCKYGYSFDTINANRLFDLVTQMGSNEAKRLKKEGSGKLPEEWIRFKNNLLSFHANDVFATIKIVIKEECEEAYAQALDAVNRLLEPENEFPDSYGIDFRSPDKKYLPIKGLPKKGIHQFFANAVIYPGLHDRIEKYAHLAMKEHQWYTNLRDEDALMPSSFAVFALGLESETYFPLVKKYMDTCDDEHAYLQTKFTPVFIEKYGLTEKSLPVFISCVCSFQNPEHHKVFQEKANEKEAQTLLADYKDHPEKYLPSSLKESYDSIWNTVITTIYNCRSSKDNKIPERLRD